MKPYYTLFIIAAFIISLAACKKDSNTSITGKWQQTQIRVYELYSNNVIKYDTTYLSPFTNLDYAEFNFSGTCSVSIVGNYNPNDPIYFPEPAVSSVPATQNILKFSYTHLGSKYVLFTGDNSGNPGGFTLTDTASVINENTLLIHQTFDGHGGFLTVSDYYYKR